MTCLISVVFYIGRVPDDMSDQCNLLHSHESAMCRMAMSEAGYPGWTWETGDKDPPWKLSRRQLRTWLLSPEPRKKRQRPRLEADEQGILSQTLSMRASYPEVTLWEWVFGVMFLNPLRGPKWTFPSCSANGSELIHLFQRWCDNENPI